MQSSNLNLQVDEDFLAFCNFSTTWTLAVSSSEVDVKVENDGQEKERIGEALWNIEPMDILSPMKPWW
jgi:hypothetical protein